jgi:hypothetical protein
MESTGVAALPESFALELAAIEDYRRFAVLTIQRFWRGHALRVRLKRQARARAERARARVLADGELQWAAFSMMSRATQEHTATPCSLLARRSAGQREAAARGADAQATAQREAARLYGAARAIQDAWRGWRDRRTFRAYRDLLSFRYAHLGCAPSVQACGRAPGSHPGSVV